MDEIVPIDVIRIWTEDIRIALRAAGLRGFTLVDLRHTICASLGPGKRKANISWLEGGREWFVELTEPNNGPGTPSRRVPFDIYTVDCDCVTSTIVRHLQGEMFTIPPRF